jgi:serine/threonine-protein kinase
MYFNIPVDTAPVDTNSSAVISAWVANGGWGQGHVQVDFSIDVYYADATSVHAPFTQNGMLALPDSDIPTTVPIAPGLTAATSPAPGFECAAGGSTSCDDCHYLVVDPSNKQLIEVYGATTDGTSFSTTTDCGRSVAIWPFDKAYLGNLRGDVCTSADASGGLMAPTLFTVEEVAAGHIDHAIRFILPNAAIENMQYVRPVTHGTGGSTWAQTNGVPYGGRFRLKSTFVVSTFTASAQVVLAAMKKYGIILQDGGSIALTAKSDAFSTLKWANYLGSHDLEGPQPTDFEMVDASYGTDMESSTPPHNFTSYNCVRNP